MSRSTSKHYYEAVLKMLEEKKVVKAGEVAVTLGISRRLALDILRSVCEYLESQGYVYRDAMCIKT
jgi:Mn-dependent DtxR family transcriptional regulator